MKTEKYYFKKKLPASLFPKKKAPNLFKFKIRKVLLNFKVIIR